MHTIAAVKLNRRDAVARITSAPRLCDFCRLMQRLCAGGGAGFGECGGDAFNKVNAVDVHIFASLIPLDIVNNTLGNS
jgi:hypothetical protein